MYASVTIADWDRHGLERLVRCCARPPLAQERFGRLNDEQLVDSLRKPTMDGRTELILNPLELLDRLAHLLTPPRIHKHRYHGVLAPHARLRVRWHRYDQALSLKRAEAVRSHLTANMAGDEARLQAAAFGATVPLASNETTEGRAKTRRIDVKIDTAVR